MPRVSIIVPVYRVERYLDACVRSLLNQTFKDIEIILVDDGSPDNCPAMIDGYAEAFPGTVCALHKPNGGSGDARNYAISHTSGEYLCFVDSDDTVAPDYVEALLGAALSENADIVVCDAQRVDEQTGATHFLSGGDLQGKSGSDLGSSPDWLFRVLTNPWNKLYRSGLFHDCGVCRYPVGIIYEDLGLTPILFHRAVRIQKLDRVLYNYLTRQGSIIKSSRKPEDVIAALEIVRKYFAANEPGKYLKELEMLYIQHGIVYRYLHEWPSLNYVLLVTNVMRRRFPNWQSNPYLHELPRNEQEEIQKLKRYGAFVHYGEKMMKYKIHRLYEVVASRVGLGASR